MYGYGYGYPWGYGYIVMMKHYTPYYKCRNSLGFSGLQIRGYPWGYGHRYGYPWGYFDIIDCKKKG